jgi:hypothetical protein
MRAGLPAVLVLMVMAASAQQAKPERQLRCDIGLAEAPRPLGLELGMTVEEVSRVLGRRVVPKGIVSSIRETRIGVGGEEETKVRETEAFLGEDEYSYYPQRDTNIGSLYLRFWSGRLYTVLLTFDDRDLEWRPDEKTTQTVARKLGLPVDGWNGNTLECIDFYTRFVRSDGGVEVETTDLATKNTIKAKAERSLHDSELLRGSRPKLRGPEEPKKNPNRPLLKSREKLCRKPGEIALTPCD